MTEAIPHAAPETVSEPESEPAYDRGDLIARIQNEPEFAVQKFKEIQSQYTKLKQEHKNFEQQIDFYKQMGGGDPQAGYESVQNHLTRYANARAHPKLAEMIDNYLSTGQLPDASEAGLEDPMDQDPRDREIQALRQQLEENSRSLNHLQKTASEDWLYKHVEKVFETIPVAMDRKEQVLSKMMKDLENYKTSESGRRALQGIMGPTGYKTVRTMVLSSFDDDELGQLFKEVGERQYLDTIERKSASTSVAPDVRSTGREAIQSEDPIKSIERFAQQEGVDLNRLHEMF